MAESQRKNSYRLEMKVAAGPILLHLYTTSIFIFFLEYLAEKFDEIVKKHTANPNPILDTSLPEQRLPPPQPEKIGILFCCLSFFLFLFNRQTKGSPPTYHQNT